MQELKIEYIQIEKLIPYVNNPRHNDKAVDAVAGSIAEFGFKNPIIVDADNVIIAGHTRLLAARKLNYDKVPIIKAEDLTDQQVKAFRIADNKTAEFAEWDIEALKLELGDLEDMFTGFSALEIEDFEPLAVEIEEDEYETDLKVAPRTKKGDIYFLGGHRLMCGDSCSKDDVHKLLGERKADLIFTDPPYDLALGYVDNLFKNYEGHCFIMNTIKKLVEIINESPETFSRMFVVDFRVPNLISNSAPMDRVDFIAEFRNAPNRFVNLKDGFSTLIKSAKIHSARARSNFGHTQAKKVELPAKFISHYSREGDIVLDLFGGSGSTLIACEQLDRKCFMMEREPEYVDVILSRWEQYTGNKGVLAP